MIPISGEEPPRAACSADEPAAVLEARQRDGELAEESRLRGNATGGTEKPKVGGAQGCEYRRAGKSSHHIVVAMGELCNGGGLK